jgi:PAS domain S-box-containing protein
MNKLLRQVDRDFDGFEAVNLTNCDREPIHIPSLIQPHGLLIILTEPDLRIAQVSANSFDILGIVPDDLLDRPLAEFTGEELIKSIQACIDCNFENPDPLCVDFCVLAFNGLVHRAPTGEVVLELEPWESLRGNDLPRFYRQIKCNLVKVQTAENLATLCDLIVQEVQTLTGFDRVMIYRFNERGDGTIIGEVKQPDLEPYLGLHYPDSDIPKQARHLYILNRLRLIPNMNYQPTGLVSFRQSQNSESDLEKAPLDMSYCALRSVSPIHIEYMQNMGVTASMVISLIHNQKLWGLIVCHHYTPKFVPYEVRTICEFLGQLMSTELTNKEANEHQDYKLHLKTLQSQFVERLHKATGQATGFVEELDRDHAALLSLTGAQGAIICDGDRLISIGETPDDDAVKSLLHWLQDRFDNDLFVTDNLSSLYPEMAEYQAIASGLMAMVISQIQHRYVIWFRPEQLQTVTWAGHLDKTERVAEDGTVLLVPRQSFEAWKQIVRGKSNPWLPCEVESASALRQVSVDIALRQAHELTMINASQLVIARQLQRSQEQELLIAQIALYIRQYLSIEDILNAFVQKIRSFLKADRTIVYQFNPNMSGMIVAESVLPPWEGCIHRQFSDEIFPENMGGEYRNGRIFVAPDVREANLSQCHLQMLEDLPTRASLIVPILLPNDPDNSLWGLLCTYQCFEPRIWEDSDIRLLQQLSVQLAIAIQQAELYRDLQTSNAELENRVAERTAELFKRQQEFVALVENSPNVILRLDRQMRHLYINPIAELKSGIPAASFVGKTSRELGLPTKNVDMAETVVQKLLATGEKQIYEIDFPSLSGCEYYQVAAIPEYDHDGEIATVLMVFTDITAKKLNEIALTEANRRWQSLLDNVRLIVVGLTREGLVEYVNPFFLESTGYELDEVIGKEWLSCFLPPDEQEAVRLAFSDSAIDSDYFHKYYQNSIVTKTGEERMIAWNNTLLRNQNDEIIGSISIGEDITEKLKVERVKDEFISVVSHELRTPLASIRGALGLLASGVLANKPEVAKNMLDIASIDIERLVRLVNDILDLERLESNNVNLDRQWCDTAELCHQAVETMQAIATASQIDILAEYKSFQIFADGDRLVQTLVNLLSNAIKFSPPQSQVQIRIESLTEAIVFHVSDHGRGIPENHLENIFERFNQVDASDSRQMGGTGLGLAICRSIVQQHGGKIWVDSKLSEGSTFSFTIPHYRK